MQFPPRARTLSDRAKSPVHGGGGEQLPFNNGASYCVLSVSRVNMKLSITLISTALVLSISAQAQQSRRLEGWERFKFGMTLAQAQKVSPVQLSYESPGRYMFQTIIDGAPYYANIYFRGLGGRLTGIMLESFQHREISASCQDISGRISAKLAATYGKPQIMSYPSLEPGHFEQFSFTDGRSIETSITPGCHIQISYHEVTIKTPKSGF